MFYTNISNDFSLILSKDKRIAKKDLLVAFENALFSNGLKIEKWMKKDSVPYEVLITDSEGSPCHLVFYLKNVTGAGWCDKPKVRRVQVSNLFITNPELYIGTNASKTLLIIGYYNFDDNPLFVAWDAYRYLKHKTMRSCYVNIDSMLIGYEKGFYEGVDSSQRVWIFTPKNFSKFLNRYIKYNSGKYE